MSWINQNWKALTVVGGILGVSAYASKYFDVEPVDDFGAESTLPRLTPKQMDFLRYSSWAMAYEAYATGKSLYGVFSPSDWKEDYTICKTVTSDGFGNENIARKTLQSLLEKKVVEATDTSYVRQDGRIRKSYAEQVNENPSLVKNIDRICLVLTPIGLEILKRMFARKVKDVVGWKIELTFPNGETAYLNEVPKDIGNSLDEHISEVKWDSQTERFEAEDDGFMCVICGEHFFGDECPYIGEHTQKEIDSALNNIGSLYYAEGAETFETDVWDEPALRKLHRDILEYVETEMPPSFETLPFNESLSRKLYEILNRIEPKLNKSYSAEGEDEKAERIMKLLRIVRRKATGSNARYAKNYAREAENAYYQYGMKGLKVQVAYVLSNLGGWRGDEAKEVKAELRKLTK